MSLAAISGNNDEGYCFLCNTKQGRRISSEDGSTTEICFWKDACDRFRATIQGEVAVGSPNRGQEIPKFVFDECYDMELYEWRKVDITDEEQKERVSQMIKDYEPFEGQPLLNAKCFK